MSHTFGRPAGRDILDHDDDPHRPRGRRRARPMARGQGQRLVRRSSRGGPGATTSPVRPSTSWRCSSRTRSICRTIDKRDGLRPVDRVHGRCGCSCTTCCGTRTAAGFLSRLDQFVATADKHHVTVMFVLFDSCWDPYPKLGPQHAPVPHRHNSGWVQAPGIDILRDPGQVRQPRPVRQGRGRPLRHATSGWSPGTCSTRPTTPTTTATATAWGPEAGAGRRRQGRPGVRADGQNVRVGKVGQPDPAADHLRLAGRLRPTRPSCPAIDRFDLANSDVISFHNYDGPDKMRHAIESACGSINRPLICTEYMARPVGSTFADGHAGAQGRAEGVGHTTGASSTARATRSTRGTVGR